MPHKRSKQSVRQADRNARGKDLPPKTNDVDLRDMPKGAMRILNGAKIQEDFHRKKKEQRAEMAKKNKNKKTNGIQKQKEGGDDGDELKIKTGEKLGDFHRRVERTMASNIHATIKSSQRSSKKRKEKDISENVDRSKDSSDDDPILTKRNDKNSERDWQSAQQKRRLNDVVDAPPILTKAPRGMLAPSLRRKAELEQERERAIKAYRLLKEKKMEQQQQQQQQHQP